MIDSLDRKLGDLEKRNKGRILALYALLSDVCHPSLGGDMIFTSPQQQQPGWICHQAIPSQDTVIWFLKSVALPAMVHVGHAAIKALSHNVRLTHTVGICTSPNYYKVSVGV